LCGSALSSITLTAQKATWLTVLEDLANGVAKIFDKLGNLANAFLDTVTGLITIGVPIIVSIVVIIIIAVVVSKVMQNRKNAAASGMAAPAKGATPG
jgi:sorbitol-specific phosphotransferase system component IIC